MTDLPPPPGTPTGATPPPLPPPPPPPGPPGPTWVPPDVSMAGMATGPGGRPVTRRKRGWVRIAVGLVVAVGGTVAFVGGIVATAGQAEEARDDAVVVGELRGVGPTEARSFTAPGGGSRPYTVYVLAGGGNDEDREREATTTRCTATFADGDGAELSGRRQSTSATVGDLRSVGSFRAPEGRVEVRCGWDPPQSSDRGRRATATYLVTPGRPGDLAGGVLTIVGGVFVALAGGALLVWGAIGRRVVA